MLAACKLTHKLEREQTASMEKKSLWQVWEDCIISCTDVAVDVTVDPDSLPTDLHKYVSEDNSQFEKEIEEWDTQQLSKVAGDSAGQPTTSKRLST